MNVGFADWGRFRLHPHDQPQISTFIRCKEIWIRLVIQIMINGKFRSKFDSFHQKLSLSVLYFLQKPVKKKADSNLSCCILVI